MKEKKKVRETVNVPEGPFGPALWRGLTLLALLFAGYYGLMFLRADRMAMPVHAWAYAAWAVLTLPWWLRWVLVGYCDGVYRAFGPPAGWLFRDPRPWAGLKRWLLWLTLAGLVLYPAVGMGLALAGGFSLRLLIALIVVVLTVLVNLLLLERYAARVCRAV